jgi:NAD(P)-dependent dehydrogenase (short-subunit alcohol dehydrogenase family)
VNLSFYGTATDAKEATVTNDHPVALVTGASQGLGRALAAELAWDGWRVIVDARDGGRLARAVAEMPARAVTAVPGDVASPVHRARLAAAVRTAGRLDLLVNNASALGPSPLPRLADLPLWELDRVLSVNVVAPLALFQLLARRLEDGGGAVVNVSSDAAVEAYEGWGGYGASKAALDRLTAVAAVEHPRLRVYAFDPGDMATDMHQRAFPGEDIGDRPSPESVVPALLRLLRDGRPSGRYRAADLAAPVPA